MESDMTYTPGTYTTRDGRKAVVLTEAPHDYRPLIGYVEVPVTDLPGRFISIAAQWHLTGSAWNIPDDVSDITGPWPGFAPDPDAAMAAQMGAV